jgi:hypothetical protein
MKMMKHTNNKLNEWLGKEGLERKQHHQQQKVIHNIKNNHDTIQQYSCGCKAFRAEKC